MQKKLTDHYHGVSKFNVETGEQIKSGTIFQPIQKYLLNTWLNMLKKIVK